VLPSAQSREVTAYVRDGRQDGGGDADATAKDDGAEGGGRRAQADGRAVRFLALPDRTTLVVVGG
jgi:hypothetical protein